MEEENKKEEAEVLEDTNAEVLENTVTEAPATEEVKVEETPVDEPAPVEETPVEEAPVQEETPVEEPKEEVKEEPVEEKPAEESAQEETKEENTDFVTGSMKPVTEGNGESNEANVKLVGLIVGLVLLAIVILGVFVLPKVLFNKKAVVKQEVNTVFEQARKIMKTVDENSLKYDLEKDVVGLEGEVTFSSNYKAEGMDLTKLKNYKITYNGAISKKDNKASVGFKLANKEPVFDVKGMLDAKKLYLDLGDLSKATLYTNTNFEVKDLEVSSVTYEDVKVVLDKTENTIKDNVKDSEISQESVEKEVNGKKGKFQKTAYKIDVNAYTQKVLEAYKSDSEVIDVLARMTNKTEKEVKKSLDDGIKSAKDGEKTEMTINLYTAGIIPKTKEVEVIQDKAKLVIDVDGTTYKYKLLSGEEEVASGTYDTNSQKFTLEAKADKNSLNAEVNLKDKENITGSMSYEEASTKTKFDAKFSWKNKVGTKECSNSIKVDLNYQVDKQKMDLTINTSNKLSVGAKVNEINKANAVDMEQLPDESVTALYTQVMTKLGTVLNDIMPGYASSMMQSNAQ